MWYSHPAAGINCFPHRLWASWEGDDERQDCLSDAPHQCFQGGHVLPGHAVNARDGGTWGESRDAFTAEALRGWAAPASLPREPSAGHQAASLYPFLGKSLHVTGYQLHPTIPHPPAKPNRLFNSTAKHIFTVYAAYLTQGMFIKKKMNHSYCNLSAGCWRGQIPSALFKIYDTIYW